MKTKKDTLLYFVQEIEIFGHQLSESEDVNQKDESLKVLEIWDQLKEIIEDNLL